MLLFAVSSELPKVLPYLKGAVRNPIYKLGQFDRPVFLRHGSVVEAAGLWGDGLQAADDVVGRAEAPEPQVD